MMCKNTHDDWGGVCPDCGEPIDAYGNTESDFRACCFPDCGCDGARVCQASASASEFALDSNVEGMWSGNSPDQKDARNILGATMLMQGIVSKALEGEKDE